MKRLAISILAILTPTLAPGGDGCPVLAVDPGRIAVLAEFPIRTNPSLLIVPVTLRGRTYQFALDTGSSLIVYDKSFEGQLGPAREDGHIITPSGSISTRYYDAPDAMLGPLSLRTDDSVTCVDLSFYNPAVRERIYGMIGMSFLKKYALTLDFTHGKIQFRHEAAVDDAHAIPIRYGKADIPLIDVALPGESAQPYMLDTGFSNFGTISVTREKFDRLTEGKHLRPMKSGRENDFAGEHISRHGALYSARFAGVRLDELLVSEAPTEDVRVGLCAIRRMNWVLDFPRRKMTVARVGWW